MHAFIKCDSGPERVADTERTKLATGAPLHHDSNAIFFGYAIVHHSEKYPGILTIVPVINMFSLVLGQCCGPYSLQFLHAQGEAVLPCWCGTGSEAGRDHPWQMLYLDHVSGLG